jgi:glycosyltransferase involved in cell wall biosynthesis
MQRSLAVAIPAFNDEETLTDTLHSVASQTTLPTSVYVVDDCSTDGTANVAERFAGVLPLTIVRNERRLGLVGNWNRCIASSREEYLWILHSDDWLHPKAIELVSGCIAVSGCGIICSSSSFFESPSCEFARSWAVSPIADSWSIHARGAVAFQAALRFVCSSVIVLRSLYDRHGAFSECHPYSPDEEMWPRLARAADAAVLTSGALTAVRRSGAHEMHRTWLKGDFDARWNELHSVLSRWARDLDETGDSGLSDAVELKRKGGLQVVRQWRQAQSRHGPRELMNMVARKIRTLGRS